MIYQVRRMLALAILVFVTAAALLAQSDRGTITGTIQDATGAVVPANLHESRGYPTPDHAFLAQ